MTLTTKTQRPDFTGAPCTKMDPDLFFSDVGGPQTVPPEVVRACTGCPVRSACLAYATSEGLDGYWAGTTSTQRAAVTRRYDRVKCPGCGSLEVHTESNAGVCLACGLSWPT